MRSTRSVGGMSPGRPSRRWWRGRAASVALVLGGAISIFGAAGCDSGHPAARAEPERQACAAERPVSSMNEPARGVADPSFGENGVVTGAFGGRFDEIAALLTQPDCRIVVAGATGAVSPDGSAYDIAVARYNADGSADMTFGSGGVVVLDIAGGADRSAALTLLPDGRVLVTGTASAGGVDGFALVRLSPDGSPDARFGSGGTVRTTIAEGGLRASGLALLPDGGVLVAGTLSRLPPTQPPSTIVLARYSAGGAPEVSFGSGGVVVSPLAGSSAAALALQPDGKILIAGAVAGQSGTGALLRFNADGSPDSDFGVAGVARVTLAGTETNATALALQPNGRIVVAGRAVFGVSTPGGVVQVAPDRGACLFIARFSGNGAPDAGFAGSGVAALTIGSDHDAGALALALQPDGGIVAAGTARVADQEDGALARVLPDGWPDPDFGQGGSLTADLGGNDRLRTALIQADGAVLAAGTSFIANGPSRLVLTRYR